MFGTSGIRGVAGTDVTGELGVQLGFVVGTLARKRSTEKAKRPLVVLARDARVSGPLLANALSSGLLATGVDVLDLGVCPTPVLAFASRQKACFGVMVTASHNPPEYNGFKLFYFGREASVAEEAEVSRMFSKVDWQLSEWSSVGKYHADRQLVEDYCAFALSLVDVKLIGKMKPKVVIDCGNGAGCSVTPRLLTDAGCQVVSVNGEESGTPNRAWEPNAAGLVDTGKIVKSSGAVLGLAHDGDADRVIALDENGELVGLDAQFALAAEDYLEHARKKGKTGGLLAGAGRGGESGNVIISTVEMSLGARELIEKAGGRIVITPVGSRLVAEALLKHKALFGGEPCGEYVFAEGVNSPDGVLAALKLVELHCRKNSFSAQKKRVVVYPLAREKLACPNEKKAAAMTTVKKTLTLPGKKSELDGVRFDAPDGWLMVRPSGTEPFIRITAENKDEKKLKENVATAKAVVEKAVREA